LSEVIKTMNIKRNYWQLICWYLLVIMMLNRK